MESVQTDRYIGGLVVYGWVYFISERETVTCTTIGNPN